MLIKDLQTGRVREYGTNSHDSLEISQDGRFLSYYNLQCGEGSSYGDFRFVMSDGKVPCESETAEAINDCCYFNIGGFPDEETILKRFLEWVAEKKYSHIQGDKVTLNSLLEEYIGEQNNE